MFYLGLRVLAWGVDGKYEVITCVVSRCDILNLFLFGPTPFLWQNALVFHSCDRFLPLAGHELIPFLCGKALPQFQHVCFGLLLGLNGRCSGPLLYLLRWSQAPKECAVGLILGHGALQWFLTGLMLDFRPSNFFDYSSVFPPYANCAAKSKLSRSAFFLSLELRVLIMILCFDFVIFFRKATIHHFWFEALIKLIQDFTWFLLGFSKLRDSYIFVADIVNLMQSVFWS